jgi:hypothetical protein
MYVDAHCLSMQRRRLYWAVHRGYRLWRRCRQKGTNRTGTASRNSSISGLVRPWPDHARRQIADGQRVHPSRRAGTGPTVDWRGTSEGGKRALGVVAQKNDSQLPRYQSERSRPLFERITSKDNLDFYRNRLLPLNQRLQDAMSHMQSISTIMKLYFECNNKGTSCTDEFVELMGAQLRMFVAHLKLVA